MSSFPRSLAKAWLLLPALAAVVVFGFSCSRVRQVDAITELGNPAVVASADSPTGYAGGVRMLIVPGHNNESYQLIVQTQAMLAEGKWRMRQADYDNAPNGRPVRSSSAPRWWLAGLALAGHSVFAQPLGLAVERAALWSDSILHLLLIALTTLMVGRSLGARAGAVAGVAIAALFPLTGQFVPGAPDPRTLALVFLTLSVLLLVTGVWSASETTRRTRCAFLGSGIAGGLALWVGTFTAPTLVGLGLGGLVCAWLARRDATQPAWPWRTWGIAGAATVVATFVIEYAPDHFDFAAWRLGEVHPLYALAWLGGAELIHRLTRPMPWAKSHLFATIAAALALLVLPAVMLWKKSWAFLAEGSFSGRLSMLDGGIESRHLATWLVEGVSFRAAAVVLPALVALAAFWFVWKSARTRPQRDALWIIAGALAVALPLACWQLSRWAQLDLVIVALVALAAAPAVCSALRPSVRLALGSGALLCAVLGVAAIWPAKVDSQTPQVSSTDLQSLIERDFAHWLARRVGPAGAVALAPPNLTTSLIFHGGLRGLGSPYRENEEGFRASIRIAGATSPDEALALVQRRGVTHIVIPSWDGFLDEYARLGANQPEHSLMGLLHKWLPPRWLRPVSYQLPGIEGYEDQWLVLFEITEVQDNNIALSRLAEYFVDMGRGRLAIALGDSLAESFPTDLSSLIARAHTAIARGDRSGTAALLTKINEQISSGDDEDLPWDRRVSLAVVLAQSRDFTAARKEVEACLEFMSEEDLRSLPTLPLYRFLNLCKALGVSLPDESMRSLARELLPPELRSGF